MVIIFFFYCGIFHLLRQRPNIRLANYQLAYYQLNEKSCPVIGTSPTTKPVKTASYANVVIILSKLNKK